MKKVFTLVFMICAVLLMGCDNNTACVHDWMDKSEPATCTTEGSTYKECSLCGEKIDIVKVDALGHDWDEGEETVSPTETTAGLLSYKCNREGCSETKNVEIPALGHIHDFSVDVDVPATCLENGYTAKKCSGCDSLRDKTETDALGHDWDTGIITTPETEKSDGVRTFTCKRPDCNETKTEIIPALSHVHDYAFDTEIVPATCTEQGYTKHICICGEFTTDRETPINTNNHEWDHGTVTTEPYYERIGVMTYVCKRDGCSETKTEEFYYGTKLPSAPKAIGDIVFTDGSATPYTEGLVLSDLQKSKAETVIFYTGGNKDVGERVLGVHIINSGSKTFAWCSTDAKCYDVATGYNKNKGSVHWPNICKYDQEGTSAENRATMYPAFNYVLENFPSEFYVPAFEELYRIYDNKEIVNAAIEAAGGIKIVNSIYITSSHTSVSTMCHYVRFLDGHGGGMPKEKLNRVCAIREYK